MSRNALADKKEPKDYEEKDVESLFEEILTENFPNLGRNLEIQVHEANFMFQFKTILPKTNYSRTV